jgi:hypothetical protein
MTGISEAIRRFMQRHVVADDPMPERSWLDQQDMPRVPDAPVPGVSGQPVEPLAPLPGRHLPHGLEPAVAAHRRGQIKAVWGSRRRPGQDRRQ